MDATVKVFGIGLNKTGTTTLGACGRILGYRTKSWDRDLLLDVVDKRDLSSAIGVIKENDFFEDWPWPLIYQEIDKEFPKSKFILTTRADEFKWLQSLKNHSLRTNPFRHVRKLVYGHNYPHRHEDEHIEFYLRHNESVREYFKHRPNDLLEVCWENNDGWNELCGFLGKSIPETAFPHSNRGIDKDAPLSWKVINHIGRYIR